MNSSPNTRLTQWLLGALLTLSMFIAGMYTSRLAAVEGQVEQVEQKQYRHGERISVTEAYMNEANRRLESIEKKLDRALQ